MNVPIKLVISKHIPNVHEIVVQLVACLLAPCLRGGALCPLPLPIFQITLYKMFQPFHRVGINRLNCVLQEIKNQKRC